MSDSEDDLPLAMRSKIATKSSSRSSVAGKNTTAPLIKQESDDLDNEPLANRKNLTLGKRVPAKEDTNSVDSKSKKAKTGESDKKKKSLKKVKRESDVSEGAGLLSTKRNRDDAEANEKEDNKPTAKRGKSADEGKAAKAKKIKEEEAEEVYKWWEEEAQKEMNSDNSIKWTSLEHNGVLFPPEYQPHGVKMKYDGKPVTLTPEAEEVASFFAALLETDHAKNPTFQKNFFRDWKEILDKDPRNPKITSFEKCDFRPIWEKFEADKEKKKAMTKEEKAKIKEERAKTEEPFIYAYVDGRKEKVGNFRIEPPGLFRGRGDHPKTGTLKQRVQPEQVTLNLSKDAKIPPAPPGHKWGSIVHDQTATWLASWKENVNGTIKYVFLAQSSAWKGQSDMQKFDKARELKKFVDKIRKEYTAQLKDKSTEIRQRATAMYLIDRLALRAGNEKGEDEADTVGCCSLRYEHIELVPPNTLKFDFLGKDSIRYQNSVQVDPQVYKNIKLFKSQGGHGKMIFDRLTTTGLNKHLNSCMKGLSAKVFRTYNASHTFQQQLDKLTVKDDSIHDKLLSFNRANRDVAVLCNHQRSVPKTHSQQMERIQDKIGALKFQRMKLRKQIFYLDPTLKKKRPELAEDESDMEEEWIINHEADLVAKERERIKSKFTKENEKLKAEGKPTLSDADLEERLKTADELKARLKMERKTGRVEPKPSATVEKLLAAIAKLDERINATKIQATDKEENKEIALGTSRMNYIDPRISIAWCHKYNVPIEKVYNKTLITKFRWATNVDANWVF